MNNQENIPDKILRSGKDLPFQVPDSYFDEFPGKMQDRLNIRSRSESKKRSLRPILAAAAMIIVIITLGYTGLKIFLNNEVPTMLSEDDMAETIEYFAMELDNSMLASVFVEMELDMKTESIESEADGIIQYLSEDEIDFDQLLNEE